MELIIATHNLHKIREFRDMFKVFKHIELLSLHHFPHYKLPEETGSTFEQNAILKAEDAAKSLNAWVLSDDSGLVVPALGGVPGIQSSRYAGVEATDVENRKKLLDAMQCLADEQRDAYFECCLALASPQGLKKSVSGICSGTIVKEERGSHGFGYDPLFLKHEYDKTFAEVSEVTKNRISHRRKAFEKLIATLEGL